MGVGLLALLCLLYPAAALAEPQGSAAGRYVDPPVKGLTHAGQWIVEVAPSVAFAMRSALIVEAKVSTGFGLDLRLARGLTLSGDELGVRLRPLRLGGEFGLLLSGGYRLYTGREQWKTHLELELALPWIGGPEIGLRIAGGLLRELGPKMAILFEGGLVGAVGKVLLGWAELRLALQLRF